MRLNLLGDWKPPPPVPRVLLSGVDTLELFTVAKVRPEILTTFERLKREAAVRRAQGDTMHPVTWACELEAELECELVVSPKGAGGKGCAFKLEAENVLVLLVHTNAPEGTPTAYVELRSRFLWARGFREAARLAEELLRIVCEGEISPQVTRVDLSVDFCGPWLPTIELFEEFTGRAVKRAAHVEWDDEREDSASLHLAHRRFTGFSFGRGVVVARLYLKSLEIKGSNKLWFRPLWRKAGTWRDDERDGPVWRLEFQLRREAVKNAHVARYDNGEAQVALKISSWAGCEAALGNIWRGLSRSWLSLRAPRTEFQRVILTPAWEVLHQVPDFPAVAHAELYRRALDYGAVRTHAALAGYLRAAIAEMWQRSRRPGFLDGELLEAEVMDAELRRVCHAAVEAFEAKHGSFYGATVDKYIAAEGRRALAGDLRDQVEAFLGSALHSSAPSPAASGQPSSST
jgi:hypothetical protein